MQRRMFLVSLLLVVLAPVTFLFARPLTYRVEPTYAHVSFTVSKWVVFKEEGFFKDVEGTIAFDPEKPSASRVEITVRAASLDTNDRDRDETLRSEDFFAADRFPTLRFVSTGVTARGADQFDVTGDLTIRGVTRRITVRVKLLGVTRETGIGELAGFESTFTINRKDFGVLGARWSQGRAIIGDMVTISLRIGGIRGR